MKEDFSELVDYLDKKFDRVDQQFSGVDRRFINGEQKIIDISEKIESLVETKADKSDINNLVNAVDAYAKKADAYFQEMLMLAQKVDRHEKWLHQVAEKLGVKLEY
ncbi:MAG: hypothetical protein PHF44_03355 [Candidatus Pacebacteria bacterium]|nr:hypothetical protein [Candidatus Paceibacterota bacterium]